MRENLDLEPAHSPGPSDASFASSPSSRQKQPSDQPSSNNAIEAILGRKGLFCFFSRKWILTLPSSGKDADGRFCPAERQCDAGWMLKSSRREGSGPGLEAKLVQDSLPALQRTYDVPMGPMGHREWPTVLGIFAHEMQGQEPR